MNTIKQHTYLFLLALASLSSLPGCSADDLPGSSPEGTNSAPASSFQIHVTDGGYASADAKPGTRAEENDYKTVFTEGDRIGVFAVKGSKIVDEVKNLCLTAQSSSNGIVWQTDDSKDIKLSADATYYAYYPYQQSLTGSLSPNTSDAAGFFANVISSWSIDTDQGTYANYTAQDLMIAKGTLSGKELSFSMQHQMALVVIELPKTKYIFNNDPKIPDYIIDAPNLQFTDFTPCRMSDGTYRYLVKPDASKDLSGSYTKSDATQATWKFEATITLGNYKVFKVDEATVKEISHTLTVGDFYMKDGSLVGKVEELSTEEKADCIGIVMKVGKDDADSWKDDCDYKLKDGISEMNTIHGYVLALYDANDGSTCPWGPYTLVNTNTESTGFYGYSNTQTIIDYDKNNGRNLQNNFPATYHATTGYEEKYPAPNNSSGWFLPSIGQCKYWLNNSLILLTQVEIVTGISNYNWQKWYWSSTEDNDSPTNYAWYVYFNFNGVGVFGKNRSDYVRSCLAF